MSIELMEPNFFFLNDKWFLKKMEVFILKKDPFSSTSREFWHKEKA